MPLWMATQLEDANLPETLSEACRLDVAELLPIAARIGSDATELVSEAL